MGFIACPFSCRRHHLWRRVVVVALLLLASSGHVRRVLAQGAGGCSPADTGPSSDISVPSRFEDALRTAVSPISYGLLPPGTAVHARDGDPMSAVQLDLLRHLDIEKHPCLSGPFGTRCGLSPTHPAASGAVVYSFVDPASNLRGHAVQTEFSGICLDKQCVSMTTVALHRPDFGNANLPPHGGVAACSYQLVPGGGLASVVAAASTVEEVDLDALAAERRKKIDEYGVVVRHANRMWRADGYRDIVLPIPTDAPQLCCDLRDLKVAELDQFAPGLSPRGEPVTLSRPHSTGLVTPTTCGACPGATNTSRRTSAPPAPSAGPDVFPSAPPFRHFANAHMDGDVALGCARFGNLLRVASAAAASTQDGVATGLNADAFLSAPPRLASTTEIGLSVVTAVQGLVAVAVLLFVREDDRLRSVVDWYRRTKRLPALPSGPGAPIPRSQLLLARCLLWLLALGIALVEFLPLVLATSQEIHAHMWKGSFAHVDLVTMMPGHVGGGEPLPTPTSTFPAVPAAVLSDPAAGLPCSTGVTFMLIPVLGRARFVHTNWILLFVVLEGLGVLLLLVLGFRLVRWWRATPCVPAQ